MLSKRLTFILSVLVGGVLSPVGSPAADEEGFRPLLNGRNLEGWVYVNTPPETWSVKDGMLVCTGKPIGELRTDRMYQNFILEVEWRHMRPRGNAGIFIWADDITAPGVPFHRGIEVQVLENSYGNTQSHTTHGDIFPIHGARMTPVNGRGGSRAFPTENRSRPSPEWNHYRITCVDGEITLAVNGKVVTKGTDCSPRKGYLCIESEGGVVHYRNMRIKELRDTPIADEHVAIADRGYRSIYSGLGLDGWKTAEASQSHWKSNDWILSFDGESKADDRALVSNEVFDNLGFVVDVRPRDDASTVELTVGGADSAPIQLKSGSAGPGATLKKPGNWNRIEGTLVGDRLTVSLNGSELIKDRQVQRSPAGGPLRLLPTGPVDFANIYVRSVDAR